MLVKDFFIVMMKMTVQRLNAKHCFIGILSGLPHVIRMMASLSTTVTCKHCKNRRAMYLV